MITVDFKSLRLKPGCKILDIGCGSGRHTAAAYDLDMGQVVGADSEVADLREARSRLSWHESFCRHDQGRWSLCGADITALPFKDRCFDLVVCSEVLEHIPDHGKALQESIRVLKPGHDLVVSVPRRWPESICWAFSRQYRTTRGGHIRIYHARRLIRRIQSFNMIHWMTHYAHSLHAPFWWLKCLLGPERDHLLPVFLYQRLLTWDIMKKPRLTRLVESALNPVMGKSVVMYFRKS